MGRFYILNFTQFSQNSLLTMKYCSVKDCKCKSSCENDILRIIKEKWILIVTWPIKGLEYIITVYTITSLTPIMPLVPFQLQSA